MAQGNFADRLMPIVGKPAATMFVEEGIDRHFLVEAAFLCVASYLGGKFLDGFVDGLGVTDLGKTVGKEVKTALVGLNEFLIGPPVGPAQESVVTTHTAALQDAADKLMPYAANEAARLKAEEVVSRTLEERGIPGGEARRIAKAVGRELLPVSHDVPDNG
jgi:hypothetical protein